MGTRVTTAFPQLSAPHYRSVQGGKGLSQDCFSSLEEKRQYWRSQEQPGSYPTPTPLVPNVRAGLGALVGVVVKLAVKSVSNLSL